MLGEATVEILSLPISHRDTVRVLREGVPDAIDEV